MYESNYDTIKTMLTDRVNASDLFNDQEKLDIMSETGITPITRDKISSEYDPSQKYVPRGARPEWATIGLIGQIFVEDDGTCTVPGYCKVGVDGKATLSTDPNDLRWRVMKRTSANTIKILFR